MGEQTARFADLVRRYREAAGWSQEELAERAGLSANAIGALERGERRRPYPNTVRRLGIALGLNEADQGRLVAAARARDASPPETAGATELAGFATPALPQYREALIGRGRRSRRRCVSCSNRQCASLLLPALAAWARRA